MNVCMFTNTYLPHVGGVAKSVSTFAEDLRKLGHRVQIIAPTFPGTEDLVEEDVVRVPAIQNFNGSDFSVRIPLPGIIKSVIKDFKPDIIHSHHPFLLGDAALRIARSLDLPLVFTHHTLYERYTHYVPFDSNALKRFAINLATEYANLCHRVIAPGTDVKRLLIERGVRTSVEVLPTGIDIDFFNRGEAERFRRAHGVPDDRMVIGHVGRLAREKNLPFLARAVAGALGKHGKACFVVAGKGDAEQEIREIFARQHLEQELIMVGSLVGHWLADCYAAMDIFAFASHSETQGLVLAEAMAAATPVVALSASGVNDVLRDTYNGVKLEENATDDEFGEALAKALADREQLASWSRAAVETAKEFSREKSVARLVDLYRDTISGVQNPHKEAVDMFDEVLMAIKTEWELFQEKTTAAVDSFSERGKGR